MSSPRSATHCHGCGLPIEHCSGKRSCGRGGRDDLMRFCPRCGWRLRDIAVVPGVAGSWCRVHGTMDGSFFD